MSNLRAPSPGLSAAACLASVEGAPDVRDRRLAQSRRLTPEREIPPPKPRARKPRVPAEVATFSPYEHQLYGVLRVKHGMSRDQATAAVLRSRRAEPNRGEA